MSVDNTRLIAAIDRNFAEINNAILKLKAYNSLCASKFSHAGMSFFFIAHQALFNDMIANAIRVLDKHKDAASLWYIIKCNEAVSKKIANQLDINVENILLLSKKLRHIREKTHFHIDKDSVVQPKSVWKTADISGSEFVKLLDDVANYLAHIKKEMFGGELLVVTKYDALDVKQIVSAYEKWRDC